jgi:hypothetical protein
MRLVRFLFIAILAAQLSLSPVLSYGAGITPLTGSGGGHSVTGTDDDTPPAGDDWLDNLFKKMIALMAVSNPLNWVYYAGAGTLIYYKFFYQTSLNIARYARANARREAAKNRLTREQKEEALKDIDQLIAVLEKRVAEAEKAIPDLDRHIRSLKAPQPRGSGRKGRGQTRLTHFNGVSDYAQLLGWMKTSQAAAYFRTGAGAKWQAEYDRLIAAATSQVEEPLNDIIQKANVFYPDDNFQYIVPAHQRPGGKPGEFAAVDDLRPQSTPIQLHDIPGYVKKRVRGRCSEYFASLVSTEAKANREAGFFDFWLRQGNIRQPLFHGLMVVGGLGGTYWLYRATRYGAAHSEAAKRARQKQKVEDDLVTEVESHEGRRALQPFFGIIEQVMRENRGRILESLNNNLSPDEKKHIDLAKAVDDALKTETLEVVLRRAVPFAAKKVQGYNTTLPQLQSMLYTSKTDPERREHIFKPFAKEVFREAFNSLWPDLTVGDASENISAVVLRGMLSRTANLLETAPLTPPEGDVPPAPGVPIQANKPASPSLLPSIPPILRPPANNGR